MIGERYSRGDNAYGICSRCGLRDLLHNLIEDGYTPLLRVHPECFDPRHPQERLVNVTDPMGLWRPSPEQVNVAPILTVVQETNENILDWTSAEFFIGRVEAYAVYRSTDDGIPELLDTLPVTYEWDGAKLSEPLTFVDSDLSIGSSYDYYVVGLDIYQRALQSNTVHVAYIETFYRLLENGDIRALEDNDLRVLEAAPFEGL